MNVLRSGEVIELSSAELAPGDIVFLKAQVKVPFDGIILEGDALINECALTGESVPVLKKPEPIAIKSDIKTSYIY
jgi:P-type E1-E2 ATPase